MEEWVALRPIFDVCTRDTGYEGSGQIRVPWWRQAAKEKHLKVTVEDILEASRRRRQQVSGRRGKSKGGAEGDGLKSDRLGRRREYRYAGTRRDNIFFGGGGVGTGEGFPPL